MRTRLIMFSFVMLLAVPLFGQQAQPKYQQGTQPADTSGTVQKGSGNPQKQASSAALKTGRYLYSPQFTGAERDTMRTCMTGTYGNTGANARPLPAALDSQVQLNAQLSAGLQKRLQPLPQLCASRLTMTLPANWSRALLGRHVVLLDPNHRIVDMYDLD